MPEDARQRYDRKGALAAWAMLLAGAYAGRAERALGALAAAEPATRLHLYNFPNYVSPRTYAAFTKATGIRVTRSYYASNEGLRNRLQAGGRGYDLAVPSGYMVATLAAEGLLERIDWSKLRTVKRNIDPKFQRLPHDPENRWSVPKDWGTTGFVYRTDKIKERPKSWSEFFELFEKYPRRFTLLDGSAEVVGSVAVMMGYSFNTESAKELAKVRAFLLDLKPFVHSIDSVAYKASIARGKAYGGMAWNGDAAVVVAKTPRQAARYVVAREGGEFWVDAYVIPKGARNRAAAHAWIDFVYRPKWSAEETAYTYYGSPLRRGRLRAWLPKSILGDTSLFPAPRTMEHLEANAVSPEGAELRQRIWSTFTS